MSMSSAEVEPAFPVTERLHTYALDRTDFGMGFFLDLN
jgi:hypothetical protein